MPTSCCIPGCKSNYNSKPPSISVFLFPNDEVLRQKWLSAIHRADFIPSKRSVVCIKHFDERFIIREDSVRRPDGSILTVKRDRLKLTKDAFPTYFENVPAYLSKDLPPPRKDPAKRREEVKALQEEKKRAHEQEDSIKDFNELKCNLGKKCKLDFDSVYTKVNNDNICIFKIYMTEKNIPKIDVILTIDENFVLKVIRNDILINDNPNIFNISQGEKIERWSKLNDVCNFLFCSDCNVKITVKDNLLAINDLIDDVVNDITDENVSDKLTFCKEQINLAFTKKVTYCATILTWFASIYFSFPGAYKRIRKCKFLTMPHPVYLQTFTSKLGVENSGINSSHCQYLKKKLSILDEHSRKCNLLLDEVYVKPELSYKGGKLEGVAVHSKHNSKNNLNLATTIQTFMISSILSKNKDVVGLFPCNNLDSNQLEELTLQVLKMLTEIGYIIVCIISDNNGVNRTMFEKLCKGNLKSNFENPFNKSQNVYILFDSVHLFKCVRNNWLNQIDNEQTFMFPDISDLESDKKLTASVAHLKMLYRQEGNNVVKLAPDLNKKVLFPTSIERQDVNLCAKLFDEKNVAALKQLGKANNTDSYKGTIAFLEFILQWWKVVNVKHVFKGDRFNDPHSMAIFTVGDENCLFLKKFLAWLYKWDAIAIQGEEANKKQKRNGKLTTQTQLALTHTVKTMIEVIAYLKNSMNFHYVLLGKFQTDDLEARFGQYRQMSGACYNISVKQVLESERKLKTLSVITAHSASHAEIPIKDFLVCEEVSSSVCCNSVVEELVKFEGLHSEVENVCISENDLLGLVYIGGYISHSVLKKCSCCECCDLLLSNDSIPSEILLRQTNLYFNVIDRGSLRYPSDFIINILVASFKVFNVVISERYESMFLRCTSQKYILTKLITESLENVSTQWCNTCGASSKVLMDKCISVFSNVLLNNYSKLVKEKMLKPRHNLSESTKKSSKKRKIEKLS